METGYSLTGQHDGNGDKTPVCPEKFIRDRCVLSGECCRLARKTPLRWHPADYYYPVYAFVFPEDMIEFW